MKKAVGIILLVLCYIAILIALAFTIHDGGCNWPVSFLLSLGTIIGAVLIAIFVEFIKWWLD